MSLLKIDKSAEEYVDETIKYMDENLDENLLEYLRIFEEDSFKKIFFLIKSAENGYKNNNNEEKLKEDLHKLMVFVRNLCKKLSLFATEKEVKKIHILAKKGKLTDFEYRKLLQKATDKSSVKGMQYYEIKLCIKAITEFINEDTHVITPE